MKENWGFYAALAVIGFALYRLLNAPEHRAGVFVPGGGDFSGTAGATGSWDNPGGVPVTTAGPADQNKSLIL